MTGGTGADTFYFSAADLRSLSSNEFGDVINDFKAWQGDKINLSAIDANGAAVGEGAFRWLGLGQANGEKGVLWFTTDDAKTTIIIEGDINGDKNADIHIELHDVVPGTGLNATDFIL